MAQEDTNDPYKILGVGKSASEAEIKKAYRKLAKELHPDLTGGDAAKEARFKQVSSAYELLKDAEKRRRYDAGEIDASGQEVPPRQYYRGQAGQGPEQRYEYEGDLDDLGEIFSRAFRARGGGGPGFGGQEDFSKIRMRGQDLHPQIQIGLVEALSGGSKTVSLPEIGRIELHIPAGIEDGQTLRLAGKGGPGLNGGPPGDAYVFVSVAPDPVFSRQGDDIAMELPISIDEAVLGGGVEVAIPGGRVKLKIPPNSSSGRVMRLRSKGVAGRGGQSGDLLVTLKIVLPETEDSTLNEAIRAWRGKNFYDPRAGWKGGRR